MRFAIVFALVACRIDAIELVGTPCPCPSSLVCDPTTDTCQRTAGDRDGSIDTTDARQFDLVRGLGFYYKLDQDDGQLVADSSPTNRPGWAFSAIHTTWTTGHAGNGLRFNGTEYQSYVLFPATTSGLCDAFAPHVGSFTVSAWAKFDSFHARDYSIGDMIAAHGTSGGNEGGWGLGATNGCGITTAAISIATPGNGLRINRCGSTQLAVDTWYHVTGVYDASGPTLDVYLNGVNDNGGFDGTSAVPTSVQAPPACFYLGAAQNQQKLLYGVVDEFRWYSRALDAGEVAELYRVSQ